MTDVGLHRSHQQWPVRVTRLAVGGRSRLNLDRVTQWRAGSVCLQVVDLSARQSGTRQHVCDKPLLCTAVGDGQTAGRAVLVDRTTRNDCRDPVTIADRVAEPFEYQDSAAFTAHVTIRGGVEGLAPPDGREHPGP